MFTWDQMSANNESKDILNDNKHYLEDEMFYFHDTGCKTMKNLNCVIYKCFWKHLLSPIRISITEVDVIPWSSPLVIFPEYSVTKI